MSGLAAIALAAAAIAVPDVATHRFDDGTRTDLVFDGPLLGWACPRGADGARTVAVLVGPKPAAATTEPCATTAAAAEATPRDARLFRWDPRKPEVLEAVAEGLAHGALDAVDLDADGEDEVVLSREGAIEMVAFHAQAHAMPPAARVEDRELGVAYGGPRIAAGPAPGEDTALRAAVVGAFRTYARQTDGSLALSGEVDVPIVVDPGTVRFRVSSRAVRPIGRLSDGRMRFATSPEAVGFERLRVILLDPDGPADGRSVEAWQHFPSPERLLESDYARLDGAPVLIVTTMAADKLSVFGEKRLRVFPLQADRTRVGSGPSLAVTTGMNLWQSMTPSVLDLDGDGRDDLVLAYWKGLKNAIAALEVRGRNPDGSFAKARTVDFEVEAGDKGFLGFGLDLDGDRRPDLLVRTKTSLLAFPGSAPAEVLARPVSQKPSRRIPLPPDLPEAGGAGMAFSTGAGISIWRNESGAGTPHRIDLDGDGKAEVVLAGDVGAAGRVIIVRFRGAVGDPPKNASTLRRPTVSRTTNLVLRRFRDIEESKSR